MRKHSDLFHTSHNISNCEINGGTYNLRSHNDLPAGKSYIIESCSFTLTSTYGGNGGSIYLTGTSANKELTSLHIKGCTFTLCTLKKVSAKLAGGAIYCQTVGSVEIIDSFFDTCGDLTNVYRGGGVDFESVSSPHVIGCTFISCKSTEDAGGLALFSCGNNVYDICTQGTSFISCECPNSSGAYEFQLNKCKICSSCLYCRCTSNGGGASWIRFDRDYYFNEISFSLYHENGYNIGKDLYFYDAETNIFFHSFTTSPGPDRVWTYKLISNTFNPN